MTEPTNNDYLSDIANVQRDSGKTNNELLKIIANNGGGGGGGGGGDTKLTTGIAQEDGALPETNVVLILGGSSYTIEEPTDGAVKYILLAGGASQVDITGFINLTPGNTITINATEGAVQLFGIDISSVVGSPMVTWMAVQPLSAFEGGSIGQVLTRTDSENFSFGWRNIP